MTDTAARQSVLRPVVVVLCLLAMVGGVIAALVLWSPRPLTVAVLGFVLFEFVYARAEADWENGYDA